MVHDTAGHDGVAVMVSAVEWSLLEPGTTEKLVGICLCRENPRAVRPRPSRGDGGIDVLVPQEGDTRRVAVYQVKYFHQNLTSSQKGQIEKSYHRLRQYAADKNLTIVAWYLTLPLNPTNENLEWLAGVTADAGFPCEWRGLDFLEGLAAKYPDVVDYYLGNGKQRLDRAIVALTDVLRLSQWLTGATASSSQTDPAAPLQPSETISGLRALHETLNKYDPHFRYDFSVDHEQPVIPRLPYLLAAVQEGDGDRWVTFKIFARFAEAVIERPVPGNVAVRGQTGSRLDRDLQLFHDYGRPFQTPPGAASVSFDLPGGFAPSIEDGQLSIGPLAAGTEQHELRLAVVDEAGVVLAEPRICMEPATRGPSGRGIRTFGTEEHGTFTFEMMTELATGKTRLDFRLGDLPGRRPADVLEGLRFLAQHRPPHRVSLRPGYGPGEIHSIDIPESSALADGARLVLEFAEALVTIQDFASVRLDMPDFGQMTEDMFQSVLDVAQLLRGETLTRPWEYVGPVHGPQGLEPDFAARFTVHFRRPLVLTLPGIECQVGMQTAECFGARIDPDTVTSHGDHVDVRFVPAGSELARISASPITDPAQLETPVPSTGELRLSEA